MAALACLAALAGCATLRATTTAEIDGRTVAYALARNGAPVVVFENGLGATMDGWATVFPAVAAETTAFAYDRPGYGRSAQSPAQRDGDHIVDELRVMLRQLALAPPYILVGHSLGGLYMQLYSRRYPKEVAGLVLVDATHPQQFSGDGNPANWPGWFRAAFHLFLPAAAEAEFANVDRTGAAVLALPPHTGIPVVILLPDAAIDTASPLARDVDRKRKDMARLNPGAEAIIAHAGHGIPLDAPDVVVAAIRRVVAASASVIPAGAAPSGRSPR
jgi:pimeloyl-ACP methyl ester carboxylesterase